ncbi:hypothetical protein NOR53_1987 [gamma proteobacterium NOR5-3]|nr:hypothetical protein NOR53_1987 [gamma proteobacterium NOR5-3]
MNAVEIEEAVSALAEERFSSEDFPFAFLEAFGNKATTIKRLRSGSSNKSDTGGVLQTNNIHIKVCKDGGVTETLHELKQSAATKRARAKFVLATDGSWLEAEDLGSGETIACDYSEFHNHFGFFLPLAGISTVKQIRESAFDIKATGRLNKLYIELLRSNPEWGTAERRPEMNHFMARLIFCFFAEDTGIFTGDDLFTATVEQMSDRDSSNTHQVMGEIFRAMNTKLEDRAQASFRPWADKFPYVNGGLFSGSTDIPVFTKIARSYLLHIGSLNWQKINPDIFGSMIQAVADDDERGALGMHYTSVPNILKVLNPLLLDDLREKLEEAGGNSRKLLNLRNRMSKIRVFDPACGSGNFLVIAYKEMRAIEAVINERREEAEQRSVIPLTNFRGIELRDFPAEIARLALIIAEYQCDLLYRGQQEAVRDFLPLEAMNWITCGNALRLDWSSICPPTGEAVKLHGDDLFSTPLDQAEIDFENEGGETYVCGNPPYQGSVNQTPGQKDDMRRIFVPVLKRYKDLDYIAAFMLLAARFNATTGAKSAFVTTNSITQGEQVAMLWPLILEAGNHIDFAHTSFLWSNLASKTAAVTCVILGISACPIRSKRLYDENGIRVVENISPYLTATPTVIVSKRSKPLSNLGVMRSGNKPTDDGNLCISSKEMEELVQKAPCSRKFIKRYVGSQEIINGGDRWCIWIEPSDIEEAERIKPLKHRFEAVEKFRRSGGKQANDNASTPYRFVFAPHTSGTALAVPNASSEKRPYLPCEFMNGSTVVSNLASVVYQSPVWNLSVVVSRLHLVWIATVCGKLTTRFRYSNTLGWHTFPMPPLTQKQESDLIHCAEKIMLAREGHFPATIADLYDPDSMPVDLLEAHERNDETLERIYIGRRFKNDTERLEKLFEMYQAMTEDEQKMRVGRKKRA